MKAKFERLLLIFGMSFFVSSLAHAQDAWYDQAMNSVSKTWRDGAVEAYVPFLSYHMPFAYSAEKRSQYTENPLGFGLGKGRYNASGNYEGIYGMVFQDSHGQPQYMLGYGWIPSWQIDNTDLKVGVGVVGFLTARADIGHYTPFPGILPVASLTISRFSLQAAYVPGGQGNGNVLFAWGKWTFD
ncbi:lipid IV(A) palmitoyltransferase PagP [Orrella sp. NBD-18]|uniref:Lipid IV(A) palmitoyltransferase PagP n=1 Tax=Sheuella amnicola TaxID=2707330 RepID=A0A6B2R0C2_9BURK|nr:lipid IV(A) palmitoyltransferase PagP [Sheuella amnicola]NDY83761.1 lipid IV(A) palmitoyltransferase PagP [Sheuella amnicola]